jgi:hypothetical protein
VWGNGAARTSARRMAVVVACSSPHAWSVGYREIDDYYVKRSSQFDERVDHVI